MAVGLRVPCRVGDGDVDQSPNRGGRAQREALFKWIEQAESGGGWVEGPRSARSGGAVGIHRRGSVFFQRSDYAGDATESEEWIGRGWFVGCALYQRRRRDGRKTGSAPRRK